MAAPPFAFIIHPIDIKRHVALKYPLLGRILSERQINFFSRFWPPVYVSAIHGITSAATATQLKGWFIAAPYTPPTMLRLPPNEVYNKLVACGHMAERLGAQIMGLGAFTSVVGDAGATVAQRLDIPVTTGDSYTVYVAVEAVRQAAQEMGFALAGARVAVVGATGAIGAAASQILAREAQELILIGRRSEAVAATREACEGLGARVRGSTAITDIYPADVIISASSAVGPLIEPEHLKPGAVVLDVALPADVSRRVWQERDDVLVVEGGMVEVPGAVDFGINFGLPPGKAYACMAETMALALEHRLEDYTIGRDLNPERILEIGEIATRHGFFLSGLRNNNATLTDEQIARVRDRAYHNRAQWRPATDTS
ncbi:MAG: shikimate dehydrogenase [Anaerolineales bacterium]